MTSPRPKSRWLPLAVFALLALLLAAGVWMSRNPDRDKLPSPLIGKPAPAFNLPVLHEPQRSVSQRDFGRGDVMRPPCGSCGSADRWR